MKKLGNLRGVYNAAGAELQTLVFVCLVLEFTQSVTLGLLQQTVVQLQESRFIYLFVTL